MVLNRYNIKAFSYVVAMAGIAMISMRFIIRENFLTGSLIMLVNVILIPAFIAFLNDTNRKIAFFIDAVKNEDATLKFPENVKNPALKKLHTALNKVNQFITDAKIHVENKEKFYEALIEHSASGLLSMDENGDFEILNNAARMYMGVEYTANIHMIRQKNKVLYDVLMSIKPGETKTVKLFVNNDYFHLSLRCSQIKYFSKNLKLISMHNIRFELEEKEIESWQKLFRVITHEIMNSIAPITSVSNTLGRMYKSGQDLKAPCEVSEKMIDDTVSGLTVIEDMGNSLMNFVNSYRSLNKIPKPEFKEIKVKPWISNIEAMARKIIDVDSIDLVVHVKPGTGYFMGDENLLNQVLINLVKNAGEALCGKENGLIKLTCYTDYHGRFFVDVEDNGTGIDSENIDQLFVPFFTTKESGTGIGLSLCRQILRLHDGNITVRSEPGKGSVFSIII